jgi:hypothetical protein
MSDMVGAARAALKRLMAEPKGHNVSDPDEIAEAAELEDTGDMGKDGIKMMRSKDGYVVQKTPDAMMGYLKERYNKDAPEEKVQTYDLGKQPRQPYEKPGDVQVWHGDPVINSRQKNAKVDVEVGKPVIDKRTPGEDEYQKWLQKNADMVKYHETKKGQ